MLSLSWVDASRSNEGLPGGEGLHIRRLHESVLQTGAFTLVILFATGCASTHFIQVEPNTPIELERDEGLLVLQIDTEVPIRRLVFTGLWISEPIPAGNHFWVARVPPGRKSWVAVHTNPNSWTSGRYTIRRSSYPRKGELDFSIEPGKINYVGALIVGDASFDGRTSWLSIRIRNHAAMALRALERDYADLLDRYPLRTAGTSGDRFLEFYAAERERLRSEAGASQKEVLPR